MSLSNKITNIITDYDNPKSIGSQMRAKRIAPLLSMIDKTYKKYKEVKIIDIGGKKNYWNILPQDIIKEKKIHITVVNLPGEILPATEENYHFIHGDACNLNDFKNNSFHIAHANSVIEHVGSWHNMMKFAQEVRRLAANIYVQTPYFWFPMEPHFMCPFFHWIPRPLKISLIMHYDLGNHQRSQTVNEAAAKLENYRLLDKKMLQELFPDCVIKHEKIWGMTKSIIAISNLSC